MKVAVLMSSYNGEKYIRPQIDSILAQEGNFELSLFVRDDGSTDKTQAILQEYAQKRKLTWYTGNNLGPARSFMDLLKKCKGFNYYAFADQDDYWRPKKLKVALKCLQDSEDASLYCCNADLVDKRLHSLGQCVYKSSPAVDFYTVSIAGGLLGCTMVMDAWLAEKVQTRIIPQKIVMHDFYIAVLCTAYNKKIFYDENSHMKYRQHGNNVVGVPSGTFQTIRNRISDITHKASVSIADQCGQLLFLYQDDFSLEHRAWLSEIANYQRNNYSMLRLALNRKTRYVNLNMAIKLRLSILLGNR